MKRYGVIDLGSNSVRLNIVQVFANGGYNLLDQAKVMVRLSENLQCDSLLKEEPMERTVHAVNLFKKLLSAYAVDHVIAVATAAVRMAQNGNAFLERVFNETGIRFQIISGNEEAYYDYLGVVNTLALDDYVMIDIGGGSTEIALIQNRVLKESVSLPFGSVILSEAFFAGKNQMIGLNEAERHIKTHLVKIDWLDRALGYPVVGMGGVVRTIGKIDKQKKKFPAVSLHNYQLSKKDTFQIIKKLIESTPEEVGQLPGASKDRADILGPGVLPLKLLMEHIGSELFVVSGNGLRDGVFFENHFKLSGFPVIVDDVLEHSLMNVMKRYGIDTPHSEHVAFLSLRLFDEFSVVHDFTRQERKLLYIASKLHDIGMHIEYYNHHRHGFYLTLNSRVYGVEQEETIKAAFIVAMHRESKFKEDMSPYKSIVDKSGLDRLKRLSLFLRMAEKLERSESQVIKNVKADVETSAIRLTLQAAEDTELERLSVEPFVREFQEYFNKKLEFISYP